MPKMSTFQIILIAVFAVLALGGLFFFATFNGKGSSKSVGVVTIWGTLPDKEMSDVIAGMQQGHQEFNKVAYVEKDPATFDTDLADALASGTGPDLIVTTQERLVSEESKLSVIPYSQFSERAFRDSFLPINEIFLSGNGFFAMPLAVDPLVLYYNRTSLSTANIPQVPRTWEALLGTVPHLTQKTDAGFIQKSAIPLGTYDNIGNARAILSALLLQSGTSITGNSSGALQSTLARGAQGAPTSPGESAVSFYTQFADPAKTVYTWSRSMAGDRQCFIAGDCTFYLGFASERKGLAAANPNLDFDMSTIPQPQTATTKVDYALAYALAIPKASKNSTGATRVLTYLASKGENGNAATALGMAPALRSLLTPAADDIYAPVFYPAALASAGWLSPSPSATDRIFAAMINDIISGRKGVRDALVTADQSLTAAL